MLEADVTLAETTRYPIPIMAHPPLNMSDITLDDWLMEVLRSETGKGIKLDFKSTRVVEPAFRVLARYVRLCAAGRLPNSSHVRLLLFLSPSKGTRISSSSRSS